VTKRKIPRRVINLALAGTSALAGFVSLVITIGSLFVGLWADSLFETRPLLTIIVMVLSVPISLLVMLKIVLGLVGKIVPAPVTNNQNFNAPTVEEDRFEDQS
jgi:hypothetical protein